MSRFLISKARSAALLMKQYLAVAMAIVFFAGSSAAFARSGPESFADLAEKVMPAVVNISASTTVDASKQRATPNIPRGTPFDDLFEEFFKRRGQGQGQGEGMRPRRSASLGSGFIVDATGIVITNNHVIGDANDITVILHDGTRLKAEIVGKDAKVDLAVLKVKSDKPLPAVKLGDSDKLRVGDWVIAVGNPFGLGGSVTAGIVSARGRDIGSGSYDDYIQTDAAINKGNSGGPLFNSDGEVVGINTAILSPSGGSVGIGFAVPTSQATPVIDQLRQFGETRRGWLGVRIQNVDDTTAEALGLDKARGALVAGVEDSGPAKPAGIEVGDVIIRFDGKDVKDTRDLPRLVAVTPVGKAVDVVVMRKGKEVTKKVTLGRLEDGEKTIGADKGKPGKPQTAESLGLKLSSLTPETRAQFNIKDDVKGVLITGINDDSAAAEKPIRPGDIIVEVGQEAVTSPADVSKRIEAVKKDGKKSVLLLISNGQGDVRFVALPLK